MKASRKLPLAVMAMLSLLLSAVPASAGHALGFACDDPSPNTAGSNADSECSFTTHRDGEKVQEIRLDLPVDAEINDVGGGDDPAHNDQIGTATVATDLNYNNCDDGQGDGGTYDTYWRSQSNWTTYPGGVPSGWTKTAEFRTEFRVLFFFTEQVATHIIKNDGTGQYRAVTFPPHDRGCPGAVTSWTITTWGHVDQDTSKPGVGRNPSTADTYTVNLTVIYTDSHSATDSDDFTIV